MLDEVSEIVDPALPRAGRFDRRLVLNPPDANGRSRILQVHVRDVPLADDVDLGEVAASTPGMTGADLRNLVNEAALAAARRRQDRVHQRDFTRKLVDTEARRILEECYAQALDTLQENPGRRRYRGGGLGACAAALAAPEASTTVRSGEILDPERCYGPRARRDQATRRSCSDFSSLAASSPSLRVRPPKNPRICCQK